MEKKLTKIEKLEKALKKLKRRKKINMKKAVKSIVYGLVN